MSVFVSFVVDKPFTTKATKLHEGKTSAGFIRRNISNFLSALVHRNPVLRVGRPYVVGARPYEAIVV